MSSMLAYRRFADTTAVPIDAILPVRFSGRYPLCVTRFGMRTNRDRGHSESPGISMQYVRRHNVGVRLHWKWRPPCLCRHVDIFADDEEWNLNVVDVGGSPAAPYDRAVPGRVLRLFGHDISVAGHHADASTPIRTGTTMLLGALLLVGVASIGRWRRWPRSNDEAAAEAQDPPLGIDGLGLPPRPRSAEPEFVARYPTGAGPAGSQSTWTASSRGTSEGTAG
jgi:hypothetical protein